MPATSGIDLSPDQLEAQNRITDWYTAAQDDFDTQPIFRVFGYAGTGKTTIIRDTIEQLYDVRAGYAAFTGKAALIMQKQGLPASTIHSLIYKLVPPAENAIRDLEKQIREAADVAEEMNKATGEEKRALRAKLRELTQPKFVLNNESPLNKLDLLVLDECSMVNDEMLNDLLYFEVPLLVLGDPGQLPPINGTGALVRDEPDVMLTQIHRQAAGNPIIDYATRARNGIAIPYSYADSDRRRRAKEKARHVMRKDLSRQTVLDAEQVICGKNVTRRMLNARIREHLGYENHLPLEGDKLICLRNNAALGLFNGMFCEVLEVLELLDESIELLIRRETDDKPIKVEAVRAHFDEYHKPGALENVRWYTRARCDEFDFGYAITVHKAQGSQWDDVLLYDDGFLTWKPKERRRWLYTGCTRAAERLILAD